ncbi:uncharacterized protein si:ch211-214j24.10 [Trichomycterus rosablanca]|uniref:uncharacterized protein si:ch211-214j24.10 n=1 Tax=Trichomycterus rosablanca TaxID=2290929 RepID=UPI002F35F79A
MHIKTGTWEANNAVCESDALCDPAVIVSPPQAEPHIRNRRFSPGSGSCGGGGGGCTAKVNLSSHQTSHSHHEVSPHRTGHTQPLEREQRGHNRSRVFRRDGGNQGARYADKPHRSTRAQKERWMGETLSSLRPPPAFPVKDSPAKLQPAVSYASKVKAGGASVGVADEPPGIGALLQNQWGLSFITDSPAVENVASDVPQETESSPDEIDHPVAGEVTARSSAVKQECDDSALLLLSCRHLTEALRYHTREWNAVLWKHKQDAAKVVWYKDSS